MAHGVHIPGHVSPPESAGTGESDVDLERAFALEREVTLVDVSDGVDGEKRL